MEPVPRPRRAPGPRARPARSTLAGAARRGRRVTSTSTASCTGLMADRIARLGAGPLRPSGGPRRRRPRDRRAARACGRSGTTTGPLDRPARACATPSPRATRTSGAPTRATPTCCSSRRRLALVPGSRARGAAQPARAPSCATPSSSASTRGRAAALPARAAGGGDRTGPRCRGRRARGRAAPHCHNARHPELIGARARPAAPQALERAAAGGPAVLAGDLNAPPVAPGARRRWRPAAGAARRRRRGSGIDRILTRGLEVVEPARACRPRSARWA